MVGESFNSLIQSMLFKPVLHLFSFTEFGQINSSLAGLKSSKVWRVGDFQLFSITFLGYFAGLDNSQKLGLVL